MIKKRKGIKKVCAPDLVDEICKLSGLTKRDNPGTRILSNDEIKQVLLRLQIMFSIHNYIVFLRGRFCSLL